jgi:dTMP kinase
MIKRQPDLTILIDMDPELGHQRAKARNTKEERFEDFGVDLQRRMRAGFLQLAKEFPDRIRIVNGNQSVEDLSEDIYGVVQETLL